MAGKIRGLSIARIPSCVHLIACVIGLWGTGCTAPQACQNLNRVRCDLQSRTGIKIDSSAPCQEVIPSGVVFEDGLSETEAVTIALANNSAFQSTLAQLGMACGDSVQASLLANPQVLLYFPVGAKEGQATLYAPIESYLLRPTRMRIANREYQRIGEQLVQNGLNLARDVRVAYADFALATERLQLAREASRIREGIADLTDKRLKNGDISELETITSRVDSLNAGALVGAEEHNVNIARARLISLIGIPTTRETFWPEPLNSEQVAGLDEAQLIATALACRPDFNSAQWLVAAAQERCELARRQFWRIDGVVDTRYGADYARTGTGLRFDLPIFNRNQGGILRADWELNAAAHNRDAIRDQIYQDVRVSLTLLEQAQANLRVIETDMLPKLTDSIQIAQKGFADGGTDYLLVLQTTSQYLDARLRVLLERANSQRAKAELERSISRSLSEQPLPEVFANSLPTESPVIVAPSVQLNP